MSTGRAERSAVADGRVRPPSRSGGLEVPGGSARCAPRRDGYPERLRRRRWSGSPGRRGVYRPTLVEVGGQVRVVAVLEEAYDLGRGNAGQGERRDGVGREEAGAVGLDGN